MTIIAVHCTATASGQDIGAYEIRRVHRRQGWFDIGYHYVIRRDGTLESGRPSHIPGAHLPGHNHEAIGIGLVGANADDVTEPQLAALSHLLRELEDRFPKAAVQYHID